MAISRFPDSLGESSLMNRHLLRHPCACPGLGLHMFTYLIPPIIFITPPSLPPVITHASVVLTNSAIAWLRRVNNVSERCTRVRASPLAPRAYLVQSLPHNGN